MTSLIDALIMRSKAIARRVNQGSSGDEYEPTNRHHHPYHRNSHHHHHHHRFSSMGPDIPTNLSMLPLSPDSSGNYIDQQQMYSKTHDRTAERFLSEMARLQEPIANLDIRDDCVYSKILLPRGTRFGPFAVKLCNEPTDRRFAWEVIASSNARGWLEPVPEVSTWLRKIRNVQNPVDANLQHILQPGYLCYEVCRDIPAGEELTIDSRPKTPLQLNDSLNNVSHLDDKSERENGSQYSGNTTGEDDFNTSSNELDNSKSDNHHSHHHHHLHQDRSEKPEDQESDDENGIDFRCFVCDKQYHDLEHLDDHLVAAHHYRKDEYRCELCPKSYSYRPSLLRHRALLHGDVRKYPCENCTKVSDEVFCDPSNLQRHIRAHHVGARSHACPECGKTFATSSGLKQHTHIHSSVKPFQCEVCFKAYTQFSNLCRHKRMHADCRMQIKCNKCGQSFSTVTSLSKHKRFCDSTSTISSHHGHHSHHQQVAQQQQQQSTGSVQGLPGSGSATAMTTPPNPFFMFRGPQSFFPPGFPPYNLTGMFPPSAAQAPNFPLLFPKHHMDMTMPSEKGRHSPPSRHLNFGGHYSSRTTSDELMPPFAISNSERCDLKGFSHFPQQTNGGHCDLKSRLHSPPSRHSRSCSDDDTSSSVVDLKVSCSDSENTKVKEERTTPDDKKPINVTTPSPVPEEQITTPSEQPLDLSVARKRKGDRSPSPEEKLKSTSESEVEQTPTKRNESSSTPSQRSYQASPTPSVSPGPTPSPSPPASNGPPMAYPRPIHPMLLEAMYRPAAGLNPAFQRPFPFLGPMGGRPAFDHLLNRNGPFPPKPFHEALMAAGGLSSGMGVGKIKDRYTCKFCGKVFPRSANLTRHLRTHTGEQPYTCKYCERAFSISSNLQRHVRNIHNKERPFKCHLCDRCFGQQTNLDRHLKKHEADSSGLGIGLGDSPSSNEADREDSYFDEIRSFMGKVTYSEDLYTPTSIGGGDHDTEYGSDVENDLTDKDSLNNNDAIEVST